VSGAAGLEIADRIAIEDVIVRYATAMDTQDWELYRACFRPDARTVMDRVGEFDTVEAVIALLAPRLTIFAALQHFVSNFVISGAVASDGDGDGGLATARNYFVSHHVPHGADGYTYGGTFDFDLARDAEGWRITAHTIRILWEAGRPLPVAPLPVAPLPVAPLPVAPLPVAPLPVAPTVTEVRTP
jgi:3-phenylpropionate/cinnamic acid dioxygenase small subunit